MNKSDIVGVVEAGIMRHISGEYLCVDKKSFKFYLGKIEEANIILGSKEFNKDGLVDMYRRECPNKDARFELELRTYVYMRDLDKSFIVTDEMMNDIAWLYAYNQK